MKAKSSIGRTDLGTLSPDPWDLSLTANPDEVNHGRDKKGRPQGTAHPSWPRHGARVASPRRPILRAGMRTLSNGKEGCKLEGA